MQSNKAKHVCNQIRQNTYAFKYNWSTWRSQTGTADWTLFFAPYAVASEVRVASAGRCRGWLLVCLLDDRWRVRWMVCWMIVGGFVGWSFDGLLDGR